MTVPIRAPAGTYRLPENRWHLPIAVISQTPPRVFAHISQGLLEAATIEIGIKRNQVQVCRHDHEGVNTQTFLLMTIVEAICNATTCFFTDEDREPESDAHGQEIKRLVLVNPVPFRHFFVLQFDLRWACTVLFVREGIILQSQDFFL